MYTKNRMRITRCSLSCCLLSAVFTLLGLYAVGQAQDRADLAGPLRVCAANPRYFADPAGHPVYLTGLHTWVNLQDAGPAFPPPFDGTAVLYLKAIADEAR